ncbi:antitoxin [Salinisphaera japonica]|uniref:Twitching motility protein PilT n=1 Tax=Salinisphaera japonica YTM-1 TaxID=1209778 RepID=A0A423Q088_9GAMM|nr:AbrB/MazE/SpoVT family DNA-binding domain-containing protein [Salinisphaera japonica]ROO31406.1 twitching motility protein PilT [Salinisphaera japonica YTM-1]
METERHARLFKNGRSQALRIPKEFELPGNEAIIRKEGNRLIIEPVAAKPNLLDMLATLSPIEETLPIAEDMPPDEDVQL